MKTEITKMVSEKDIKTLEFDIYEGFKTLEEVEIEMSSLGLYENNYIIIKFMNMHYGVAAPNASKSLVMGKEISWIKESNIWNKETTGNFELPFSPDKLSKGSIGNKKIVGDMEELDSTYELLNDYRTGWRDIRGSYIYSSYYVELLGRTFYNTFFEREDISFLTMYGVASKSSLLKKFANKRIEKVNPFRTEALFVTGKVHRMIF